MNRQRLGRLIGAVTTLALTAAASAVTLPHSDAVSRSTAAVTYAPNVKVMTYNIHHAPVDDYPTRTWPTRVDEVVDIMSSNSPAIMGVQEASRAGGFDQSQDILTHLHADGLDYDVYPAIADTAHRSPDQVYWRTSRFTQAVNATTGAGEGGTVDLPVSDSCPASFVWTVLDDHNPVSDGWRWNTYIVGSAHLSAPAACESKRLQQAQTIMSTLQGVRDRLGGLPIILTGDFNANRPSCHDPETDENTIPTILTPANSNHDFTLLAALACTKPKTGNTGWDDKTTNDVDRIDYVFYSKDRFSVGSPIGVDRTMSYATKNSANVAIKTSPSDHYAVVATLVRQ